MEPRAVLKSLRDFAARELEEKRADRIDVCRVKMGSVMRKGRLPDLRVWMVSGTHYLICVFSGKSLRIYYMDKRGQMLSADEFAGAQKEMVQAKISKMTKKVFRLST